MKKNINLHSANSWPIRQIVLGIVLFVSGVAVGYTARDIPPILAGSSDPAGGNANDDPSWGPADAKVTIVAFGDFECPYCRRWFTESYDRLVSEYGDKVRFIHRDFPLAFHSNARPAAIAADCANAQGKYWDFFRKLYADPRGLGSSMYQAYAQEVGMDLSAFNTCVSSNLYDREIDLDMEDAARLGVDGVPAFFINRRLISGAQPYETFRAAIEEELRK